MLPQSQKQTVSKKRQILKWGAIGVAAAVVIIYAASFFIPRPVTLSYSDETCASGFTLLPGIHSTSDTSRYNVTHQNSLKVGGFEIAALRTCLEPTKAPSPGTIVIANAPGGWLFARTHFSVTAPKLPAAKVAAVKAEVPATKPLLVPLDQPDSLFEYNLAANDGVTSCSAANKALECELEELKLEQGKEYDYQLTRSFKGQSVQPVGNGSFKTLKAVTVTKTSVKEKQIIYSKPKELTITMDKPVVGADVSLKRVANGKATDIEADVSVKDKIITLLLAKDLPRESSYRLMLRQAEATDGSTMIEPLTRNFTISGGPKVTSVNIGSFRVSQSATVIVNFDQAISSTQSVSKYVSLTGGTATVARYTASSIAVTLQNLPRCQDFTVSVRAGLKSKYDIVSDDSWTYGSRPICHTVSTIGTSRQGRAINAYYFGTSGPVTLFVGALHGNEVSSSLILQDWINELEVNPGRIAKNTRVVIVPAVNPDGVVAGTRNNAKGVNLNRNFPTDNWEKDIDDTNGFVKGGGGSAPLSEPEAKALANLSTALKPRLMISYHAVGSVVIGDPGGYSAGYAAKYASLVGYRNATGQSAATFDYGITGSYEDWTIQKVGIPSMVVELGSYSFRDFSHHRAAFWAML